MSLANPGLAPEQMPEAPVMPEQGSTEVTPGGQVEQTIESDGGDARNIAPVEDVPVATTTTTQTTDVQPVAPVIVTKSPELVAVEKILSDGLEELYSKLPENRKAEFKQKGEQAASAIEKLLQSAKVQVKKVVSIIRDWLLMIPGVNKFFLEQEIKIKTDKLLDYKAEKEGRL